MACHWFAGVEVGGVWLRSHLSFLGSSTVNMRAVEAIFCLSPVCHSLSLMELPLASFIHYIYVCSVMNIPYLIFSTRFQKVVFFLLFCSWCRRRLRIPPDSFPLVAVIPLSSPSQGSVRKKNGSYHKNRPSTISFFFSLQLPGMTQYPVTVVEGVQVQVFWVPEHLCKAAPLSRYQSYSRLQK